jgi:hypothetical protein
VTRGRLVELVHVDDVPKAAQFVERT